MQWEVNVRKQQITLSIYFYTQEKDLILMRLKYLVGQPQNLLFLFYNETVNTGEMVA